MQPLNIFGKTKDTYLTGYMLKESSLKKLVSQKNSPPSLQCSKNRDLSKCIMSCKSAFDCKLLSKEIVYSPEKARWADVARELCYPGIKAKFEQNENLRQFLLHTGSCILAECSYDSLWGTGIPIHHTDCLKHDQWTSQGLLGDILTQIRSELVETANISSTNQGTLV